MLPDIQCHAWALGATDLADAVHPLTVALPASI